MSQLFAAFRSVPEPVHILQGDTAAASANVIAPVAIDWSDSTSADPAYTPGTIALSAYGGKTYDATTAVWLLVAVKEQSAPYLVKESDYASMDTVLAGAGLSGPLWALWRRIEGGVPLPIPQV
jgi:hypothetical protein